MSDTTKTDRLVESGYTAGGTYPLIHAAGWTGPWNNNMAEFRELGGKVYRVDVSAGVWPSSWYAYCETDETVVARGLTRDEAKAACEARAAAFVTFTTAGACLAQLDQETTR